MTPFDQTVVDCSVPFLHYSARKTGVCDRSLPLFTWSYSYCTHFQPLSLTPPLEQTNKVFVIFVTGHTTFLATWRPTIRQSYIPRRRLRRYDMQRSTVICRAGGCHSFQLQVRSLVAFSRGLHIAYATLQGCWTQATDSIFSVASFGC